MKVKSYIFRTFKRNSENQNLSFTFWWSSLTTYSFDTRKRNWLLLLALQVTTTVSGATWHLFCLSLCLLCVVSDVDLMLVSKIVSYSGTEWIETFMIFLTFVPVLFYMFLAVKKRCLGHNFLGPWRYDCLCSSYICWNKHGSMCAILHIVLCIEETTQ